MFIVGHIRGRGTRKVFPIGETDKIYNTTKTAGEVYEVAQCLTAGGNDKWNGDYIVKQIGNCMPTATRENPNQGRIYDPEGLAPCLNKMQGGGREPLVTVVGHINSSQDGKVFDTDGISQCLSAGHNNQPKIAIPVLTPDRMEKRQNGRRFKENGDAMFTLTAQDRHGIAIYDMHNKRELKNGVCGSLTANGNISSTHCGTFGISDGIRIRRLTPKECFRLQGWEDLYFYRAQIVNSDGQLYAQAGNGVTVNVIYEIGKQL